MAVEERFTHKESVGVDTESAAVLLSTRFGHVSAAVAPTGGNAAVEYTISPAADVEADTAIWFEAIAAGAVNATGAIPFPATAARCVTSGGGSATFLLLGSAGNI